MRPSCRVFLAFSISVLTASDLTRAQAQQPQPVGSCAFARVGNALYIHSGATSGDNLVSQLYALDLTTSWTIAQPSWKSLAPGPENAFHSGAYSADNSTFYTFGRDTGATTPPASFLNAYNIKTNSWTSSNPAGIADNSRRDFFAVTNPSANKIYILGGDAGVGGSVYSNVFDTFDVATGGVIEITTPQSGPQYSSTYAAVWVPSLSAMLVIGGQLANSTSAALKVYTPSSGAWTTQATTGSFSYNRISPCAASNADGSLVAVVGGFIGGSQTGDANAYILDTQSWVWTTVPFIASKGRGNAACAIADDTFIVWGGYFNNPSQSNGVPTGADTTLLLSLSTQKWLTTYTPSTAMSSSNTTGSGSGGSTGNNGSDSGGNTGTKSTPTGLIAGVIGGVVLVLAIGGLLLYRRNRKKNIKAPPTFEFSKDEVGGSNQNARYGPYDGRPRRPVPPPDELSPALYDFENPSSSISPSQLSAQPHFEQNRNSTQSFEGQNSQALKDYPYRTLDRNDPYQTPVALGPYPISAVQNQYPSPTAQNQYHNQYHKLSPQMDEAQHTRPSVEGYSTAAGHSNYSTPSTAARTATDDPTEVQYGGVGLYQQRGRSYANADNSGIYYPPPPSASNQAQHTDYLPFSEAESRQPDIYQPYKVPLSSNSPDLHADRYHDSYGMTNQPVQSDTQIPGKRPVSNPQGGSGFGSGYEASLGAPQSIHE
ncbi:hypothetical protein BGZ98_000059 [Dissophora globulifera]|nr:hypothetical protein BGZ98_000059 [Dissophora globulifera]